MEVRSHINRKTDTMDAIEAARPSRTARIVFSTPDESLGDMMPFVVCVPLFRRCSNFSISKSEEESGNGAREKWRMLLSVSERNRGNDDQACTDDVDNARIKRNAIDRFISIDSLLETASSPAIT
jgi:hypothetical protein